MDLITSIKHNIYEGRSIMYKVMYWKNSLIGDVKYVKVEHYFKDSKKALEYYYRRSENYENRALVVSTDHAEFVYMYHYSGDFPKELRPHTYTEIFTEIESMDKTPCMYDVYANACGFTHRTFRFNQDGSTEEI